MHAISVLFISLVDPPQLFEGGVEADTDLSSSCLSYEVKTGTYSSKLMKVTKSILS